MDRACRTDEGDIGVDIEYLGRSRPFRDIADAAFGAGERRSVEAGGAAAFYRIWTLREALAKATGRGLPMVVDQQDYFGNVAASGERVPLLGRFAEIAFRPIGEGYAMATVLLRESSADSHPRL